MTILIYDIVLTFIDNCGWELESVRELEKLYVYPRVANEYRNRRSHDPGLDQKMLFGCLLCIFEYQKVFHSIQFVGCVVWSANGGAGGLN